jgi:predicted secreted protein
VSDLSRWSTRIPDQRGRRVVFLAHCLLNENTRYLGGARSAGPIREVLQPCLDRGIGIVQLPCPEQHAWGGVLKRRLILIYGSKGSLLFRLRALLLPMALWYTRRIYRKLARETAAQIHDYQTSGFRVLGVIGVDGSPICGVRKTLDLKEVTDRLARLDPHEVTTDEMNRLIMASVITGQGLYIQLLRAELDKLGVSTEMTAHDLIAELDGRPSSASVGAMLDHAP